MAIDRSPRADQGVTKGQREAIEEAMRIIAEEDQQRGIDPAAMFHCSRCRRPRQMIGSVEYGEIRLCNVCATKFEVARVSGKVRTYAEYVGRPPASAH